jgi:hypothetical protein
MTKRKDETLSNFIPISRKFFDHPLWREERTFSKAEAWLDLIASARFEESKATELIGNKLISWSRGQLPVSLRYLAKRWEWSKNKVDDFLKLLENMMMIERWIVDGQTILSLKNYETYNGRQQKGQVNEPPYNNTAEQENNRKDKQRTPEGHTGDKSNKENIENKEEDIVSGAEAPVYSQEDEDKFIGFQEWMLKHASMVTKMKYPFTIEQFLKLRKELPKEQVKCLLMKMHNYVPLLKKNASAYLTIINWSKRDYNHPQNGNNATISKDEYLRTRESQAAQVRKRAAD